MPQDYVDSARKFVELLRELNPVPHESRESFDESVAYLESRCRQWKEGLTGKPMSIEEKLEIAYWAGAMLGCEIQWARNRVMAKVWAYENRDVEKTGVVVTSTGGLKSEN